MMAEALSASWETRSTHRAAGRAVLLGAADRGQRQDQDAGAFAKRAIEQNVAFVPGAPFAKDRTATLRLSFATAVDRIRDGIARLAKAL
jgi:hypothetical protein